VAGAVSCNRRRGTLRKNHRNLPVFFDELNDALKAHDAEKYGCIPGAGRCSPVTMRRRRPGFIRRRKRGESAIKIRANKYFSL